MTVDPSTGCSRRRVRAGTFTESPAPARRSAEGGTGWCAPASATPPVGGGGIDHWSEHAVGLLLPRHRGGGAAECGTTTGTGAMGGWDSFACQVDGECGEEADGGDQAGEGVGSLERFGD